jgi:hypothetical protein
MIANLNQNYFIILAKSPNWDTEDFGDLVLKMKSRKDREVLCAVTDERNYDFLFNTLREAGKKEVPGFMFENIEMVEDKQISFTDEEIMHLESTIDPTIGCKKMYCILCASIIDKVRALRERKP